MNYHELTEKLPPFSGKILIGSSFRGTNPTENLATKICKQLAAMPVNARLGLFTCGECDPEIQETLTGQEVFFIQTFGLPEVNTHLIEAFLVGGYLDDAQVSRAIGVFTHAPYTRNDKPHDKGKPISAKTMAMHLEMHFNPIIVMGLHDPHIACYYRRRADNLYARPLFLPVLNRLLKTELQGEQIAFSSTDTGGADRVKSIGTRMNQPVIIVDKDRLKDGNVKLGGVIGPENVPGRYIIAFDDMVDTAGSLKLMTDAMMTLGAKGVYIFADHGINSRDAVTNISGNEHIIKVFYTDTIPPKPEVIACDKIVYIEVHELFAAAIRLTNANKALSPLFEGFTRVGW